VEKGHAMNRTRSHYPDATPRRCVADFAGMSLFRVLQVARAVADEINKLLGNRKLRMIHRAQLRNATQSIPGNIREGMGRKPGPDRCQAYRYARGSAEETDEHLRANFIDGRVPAAAYWRLHNRLALIVTMLDKNIS
jgi:four helix bundle protein